MSAVSRWGLIALIVLAFVSAFAVRPASAQQGAITWSEPINLSNSPNSTSVDPFLIADPAGLVHLFWAEKMNTIPGGGADTVLYSQWNGESWTRPVDLFFAPTSDGNLVVSQPHAVIDDLGIMHLIWISQPNFPYYTLFYSSAPVNQAQFVQAWSPRAILAENLSGTEYSIHLVYQPPNTLHVAFASGIQGETVTREPGVTYMRSTDGGLNWSEPVEIFKTSNLMIGTSGVRMKYKAPNTIFASWTLWNEEGNGQAVYFTRSLDGGDSWDTPITLAERRVGEYERDWNNLVQLPDGRLMAIWEGGYRAYRHAMFSSNDGETWTEAWDMFPTLIGENGFAEFATDGLDRLHLFVAQRIREGVNVNTQSSGTVEGLWHSVAQGGNLWTEPVLCGGVNPMVNPKVAILQGNTVVAVWYSSLVSEIMVMIGQIEDAPRIDARPWPDTTPVFRRTPDALPTGRQSPAQIQPTPLATPTFGMGGPGGQPQPDQRNPADLVFLGAAPVLLILPVFWIIRRRKQRSRGESE